jgi:Fe-S oxidoreductase
VTLHDSCPDRREGVFGAAARAALTAKGYVLREMERTGPDSVCCGSGGHVGAFRPEFCDALKAERLSEAARTGADVLAAYCAGCVLNLAARRFRSPAASLGLPGPCRVNHVCDLLLETDAEYSGRRSQTDAMLAGEAGEALWAQVMRD